MREVTPVSVEGRIKIPYRWPAGRLGTTFLTALRDEGKILAVSCEGCGLLHVPPRPACTVCGKPLTQWTPAGTKGTLHAWTRRGDALYGLVRLDGAWTAMLHRVIEADPGSLRVGQRVEAVIAERREGSILDIQGFRPRDEIAPPGDPWEGRVDAANIAGVERVARRDWFHRGEGEPRFRPVAVLGVAQTRHDERRDDANYAELAFEVVQSLLARTGFTHDRIDTVVTASSDFWDGRTISDMAVQDAVGAAGKSASKVSMDGVFALAYAAARVNSGAYKTCLVVAHGKASEGDPRRISNAALDPVFERPLGLDDYAVLGLQASQQAHGGSISLADLAQLAADSWNKAAQNPYAHRRSSRIAAQVRDSPRVADPLHADMIAPDSDGACAVLLADEETGRRLGASIWLDAFECLSQVHTVGHDVQPGPTWQSWAPKSALLLAGIVTGLNTIDVAEVHDASSVQTVLWRRALGAGTLLNSSGGAMGAQPGFATGLVRVAEVYERLARGEGKVGLAHGQTGFVGQAHGVWILRRR